MSQKEKVSGFSFWFRPVSAAGFGFMRIAFGLVGFLTYVTQWNDVERFYSNNGVFPLQLLPNIVRGDWRFSLLDFVPGSNAVGILYITLLVFLALSALGVFSRFSVLGSIILLYSFQERNPALLDGGDTLLRIIGFLLVLAPCGRALSLDNWWRRRRLIVKTGQDQPASERTMPIWPYRLLLWQMVWLYTTSAWEKFMGTMWLDGSAVAAVLHYPHFSRIPYAVADAVTPFSPFLTYFTVFTQAAWAFLLLVPIWNWVIPKVSLPQGSLKRALLISGVLIHGGIFVFMDVGTFSLTVFASYVGLLIDDDFRAIRHFFNRGKKGPAYVLFDGRCGFCQRSVLALKMMDWFHRLEFVNFYDTAKQKKIAPEIQLKHLQKALHVKTPKGRIYKGFKAFRWMATQAPALWLVVPFFYLPGAAFLGEGVYRWVSDHRL